MPRKAKPTPERFCAACKGQLERKRINGRLEDLGVFNRRKYCDQACMAVGQKKDILTPGTYRKYARKHRKESCERCGAVADLHVHHKDENVANNDPANLQTLCSSCHLKLHWRELGKTMNRRSAQLSHLSRLLGRRD